MSASLTPDELGKKSGMKILAYTQQGTTAQQRDNIFRILSDALKQYATQQTEAKDERIRKLEAWKEDQIKTFSPLLDYGQSPESGIPLGRSIVEYAVMALKSQKDKDEQIKELEGLCQSEKNLREQAERIYNIEHSEHKQAQQRIKELEEKIKKEVAVNVVYIERDKRQSSDLSEKNARIAELEAHTHMVMCGDCNGKGELGHMTLEGGETYACNYCEGLGIVPNEKLDRMYTRIAELENLLELGRKAVFSEFTDKASVMNERDQLLEKVEQLEKDAAVWRERAQKYMSDLPCLIIDRDQAFELLELTNKVIDFSFKEDSEPPSIANRLSELDGLIKNFLSTRENKTGVKEHCPICDSPEWYKLASHPGQKQCMTCGVTSEQIYPREKNNHD